ncbi:hypothetical protein [Allocoleopsis sp.]|uniref:hypothetical protein n=1 Tax=Allocoleopsis sp. TaxID=3088169 RepID=UPI002FD3504F
MGTRDWELETIDIYPCVVFPVHSRLTGQAADLSSIVSLAFWQPPEAPFGEV